MTVPGHPEILPGFVWQDIEQSYVDSIFAGIESITAAALADGKTDLSEIVLLTIERLNERKPDAMRAMKPDAAAIEDMAVKAIVKNFPEMVNEGTLVWSGK